MVHAHRVVDFAIRVKILRFFPCQIKSERCFPFESQVHWWRELCGVQEQWNNVRKKEKNKNNVQEESNSSNFSGSNILLFVYSSSRLPATHQPTTGSKLRQEAGLVAELVVLQEKVSDVTAFWNYTGFPARAVIGKLQGSAFLKHAQHKNSKPT